MFALVHIHSCCVVADVTRFGVKPAGTVHMACVLSTLQSAHFMCVIVQICCLSVYSRV